MEPSSDYIAIIRAERAISILHSNIINPPTSIAAAILPARMADRLKLATMVFSLEHFLNVRKEARPETALLYAALPALYVQAELTADAVTSAAARSEYSTSTTTVEDDLLHQPSVCRRSTTILERKDLDGIATATVKIDLVRGAAGLPPATSSPRDAFSSTTDETIVDAAVIGVAPLTSFAARLWDGVCAFRGRL